mmetsp:Transcript_92789/g.207789  ORF Transcript_92789/g.207789 Transcript_92789/m.207789 type:complete len:239 (-) Transcript_92789:125-841(-)
MAARLGTWRGMPPIGNRPATPPCGGAGAGWGAGTAAGATGASTATASLGSSGSSCGGVWKPELSASSLSPFSPSASSAPVSPELPDPRLASGSSQTGSRAAGGSSSSSVAVGLSSSAAAGGALSSPFAALAASMPTFRKTASRPSRIFRVSSAALRTEAACSSTSACIFIISLWCAWTACCIMAAPRDQASPIFAAVLASICKHTASATSCSMGRGLLPCATGCAALGTNGSPHMVGT